MKFTLTAVSLASLLLSVDAAPHIRRCGPGGHHSSSSVISHTVSSSVSASKSTSTTVATSRSTSAVASQSTSVASPTSTSVAASATSVILAPKPPTSTIATPAPTASTTKSATTTSSASGSMPTYTGNKKGLAFNDIAAMKPFQGTSGWGYNWDSKYQGTYPSGVEFVPMLWGTSSDHTGQWMTNANAAIKSGATALLGFNEPDLGAQSNLSPTDAAKAWKQYMEPFKGKVQLVSPAVTNGGGEMGLTWTANFLNACTGCTVDAIAVHMYDSATNIDYYKNYITSVYQKFNKPVWLTEFGASGSDAQQAAFLNVMVPWLNQQKFVARYAYFSDIAGFMVDSSNAINTVGSAYAKAT